MTAPDAVVAVPAHDGAAHLAEALESLLAQTHPLGLIVVDDCSGDGTAAIVERYANEVTAVRSEKRLGLVQAWRLAYETAVRMYPNATYYAWGSDHDLWDAEWLAALVEALTSNPEAVLAYPLARPIGDDGEPLKRAVRRFDTAAVEDAPLRVRMTAEHLRAGDAVYGLYRADALRRCGDFPAVLLPDRLLLGRLAVEGAFVQVDRPLWSRRYRAGVVPSRRRQRRTLFPGPPPLAARAPWCVAHGVWFWRSLGGRASSRFELTAHYLRGALAGAAEQRRERRHRARRRRSKARRARWRSASERLRAPLRRVLRASARPRVVSRAALSGTPLAPLDETKAVPWGTGGAFEALEVAPRYEIDRHAALLGALVPESGEGLHAGFATQTSGPYVGHAANLFRLAPGSIETRIWVAFAPDLGLIRETLWRTQRRAARRGYRFDDSGDVALPERPRLRFDVPAVSLGSPYARNYFHWWFDVIGRFLAVRSLVPEGTVLAVNSELLPLHREALEIVGIPSERILELPPDHVVEFPALYVPPSYRAWDVAPHVVSALRAAVPPRPRQSGKRLYVSRQAGENRRIVNHGDFLEIVRSHGFEMVACENLSVREQVELFRGAEAVLGTHGAGLANVAFAPEGALVIELQPMSTGFEYARRMLYWHLAALAGLRYVRLGYMPSGQHWKSDFVTDCDLLETVLARYLPAS